jgi:4a-hydroxytetrahydrobiopterin dehydratase
MHNKKIDRKKLYFLGFNMSLADLKCMPCEMGALPMEHSQARELFKELKEGWKFTEEGHLFKAYSFKNFKEALTFANKVGDLAEEQGHHPNLTIKWGKCEIELWTHKIQGLSQSDFILAAKIDQL